MWHDINRTISPSLEKVLETGDVRAQLEQLIVIKQSTLDVLLEMEESLGLNTYQQGNYNAIQQTVVELKAILKALPK